MPFNFGSGNFGGNSFGGGSGYTGGSSWSGGGGSSSWTSSNTSTPSSGNYTFSSDWRPLEGVKKKWKKFMGNFSGTGSGSVTPSAHSAGNESFILESLMKAVDMTSGVGYPAPSDNMPDFNDTTGGVPVDKGYPLGSVKDEEVEPTLCYTMDGDPIHCNYYGGECGGGQIVQSDGSCI